MRSYRSVSSVGPSFHPLARTHAAVMEAFRSHRRKKDEGIQFTGYALHLCGQGCNEGPPRGRSLSLLPTVHNGLIITMLVAIRPNIVRIRSRSPAPGAV